MRRLLAHAIPHHHPCGDGNKPTGFVVMQVFLRLVAGETSVQQLANWITTHIVPLGEAS